MDKLIDYICDELDDLEKKAAKGKLSMAEIQYLDTLAHTKKNLLTAEAMEGEGYSGDANEGNYSRSYYPMYRGGSSYAGRRGARRDSMGRYSRDDYSRDNHAMIDQLREIMDSAPDDHVRKEIQKTISKIETM